MDTGAESPFVLEVDCRGLICPLPVLETEKALAPLAGGAVVRVVCTDPASVIDIEALCVRSGYELVKTERDGAVLRFWIRKPSGGAESDSA